LDPKEQLEKSKTLGFIGKLFLGMLTNFARVVKNDKKKMGGLSRRNKMP
jgi:hypothetical protein